ncbi:hypothetical protein GOODEAATRI_017465, partial [Goodea atripinnis]
EEEGVPRENPCKLHAERPLGWDSNLRPSCNKATVLLKMKCFKKISLYNFFLFHIFHITTTDFKVF